MTAGTRSYGSSPRMRGAQGQLRIVRGEFGIIPADAGSTYRVRRVPRSERDHPRGCGEHQLAQDQNLTNSGSSPRMRGAQCRQLLSVTGQGIIPADAGSTCECPSAGHPGWDHPRGCGEHFHRSVAEGDVAGSSPRMRGAPPASCPKRPDRRDHPRGCGEHPIISVCHDSS